MQSKACDKEKSVSKVSTFESKDEDLKLPYIPKDLMLCIEKIVVRTRE
jgi:hypothetical protein